MISKWMRTGLLAAGMALTLAGCTESTLQSVGAKAEKPLPPRLIAAMKAKGMTRHSPVMARVFKEEGQLEVWKQKANGRYELLATYPICKWSGKLGPKFTEGDRQAPEGFYHVRPAQMNPQSSFHLAFNMGYPNAYDRANGRTGSHLMVHGECSSAGCYSMNNPEMEEIYALARDAFRGGQRDFQIQAYPFRMTAQNMARYRNDPNYPFWQMLKEGYDHFEITKVPPKVDVCEKRYVFNRVTEEGVEFSPTGACPPTTQPEALVNAFQSYRSEYEAAFTTMAGKGGMPAPRASIAGLREANLVADWTRRRARGERVPVEPPSLGHDGTVTATSVMGRIDSPAGRRMAAIDAEKEAKRKAAEEKAEAERRAAEARAAAEAAKVAEAEAAKRAAEEPAETAAAPAEEESGGLLGLGSVRKRITNIFE
ncbi:murein L,D-transpeptidase [Nitratireductor mangrovi]|uniref:Murein L,D-transpeptidase n=1 Tax=Nitratireductor mangrovi TaxID=2599600 RepID=A0A5B8KW83_9HYPH|nr:murein L,D-transpeptidase family protein [Nitratireductor mangrovi]QDY99798.1 murein L,D-transpeptidase [Nitratireductor mangrovi]